MNLFIWVAVILLFTSCKDKVEIIKPTVQNITESVYASGMVKSMDQYEVFSSVNGIIEQSRVNDGDIVRKGDVILTIVNETPKLNTENAQLAALYSSVPLNFDKLSELKANIDWARTKCKTILHYTDANRIYGQRE